MSKNKLRRGCRESEGPTRTQNCLAVCILQILTRVVAKALKEDTGRAPEDAGLDDGSDSEYDTVGRCHLHPEVSHIQSDGSGLVRWRHNNIHLLRVRKQFGVITSLKSRDLHCSDISMSGPEVHLGPPDGHLLSVAAWSHASPSSPTHLNRTLEVSYSSCSLTQRAADVSAWRSGVRPGRREWSRVDGIFSYQTFQLKACLEYIPAPDPPPPSSTGTPVFYISCFIF